MGRRFIELPEGAGLRSEGGDDRSVWVQGPIEAASTAVLLVHDRAANARSWDAVMRRLPDEAAVVAVDLRGRGGRWRARPSQGLADHAADLVETLDALDLDHVLAVGHGLGAAVVAELAGAAPERTALTVGVLGTSASDPVVDVLGVGFPSREEHERRWRVHPVMANVDPATLTSYVGHGVAGREAHHRWRVDLRSLVADDHDIARLRPRRERAVGVRFDAVVAFGRSEAGHSRSLQQPCRTTIRMADVDPAVATLEPAGADAIASTVARFLR